MSQGDDSPVTEEKAGVQPDSAENVDSAAQPDSAENVEGKPNSRRRRRMSAAVEWLVILGCSLVLSLLIRAFLVEVFVIPSGSMEPTLTDGNRVAVYKLGYRLHDVNRGDVVVFKSPDSGPDVNDLIKRVVALEGETFEIRDAVVHINGERIDEPYLRVGEVTLPKTPIPGCLNEAEPQMCVVPDGKVLVLGDSREGSRDGRFFGPVDIDDIVGRAFVKIWPPNDLGGL